MLTLVFLLLVLLKGRTLPTLLGNLLVAPLHPVYGGLALFAWAGGLREPRAETLLVVQAFLLGLGFVLSATGPFGLYLGVELQSYALYTFTALGALAGGSRTGGVVYFLAGSLASVLLLGGYALGTAPGLAATGGALITAGLLVKAGTLPLGGWAVPVYRGLTPATGALVMTYPKAALFAVLGAVALAAPLGNALLAVGLLSALLGSLLGLAGEGLMAVLALSGVAHAGYAVTALAGGSPADALFYAVQYAGTTSAFLRLAASGWLGAGLGAPVLRSLAGLGRLGLAAPLPLAAVYLLLLSFGGIPPLVGFYAKAAVLFSLWGAGAPAALPAVVLAASLGRAFYLWLLSRVGFGPLGRAPLLPAGSAGPLPPTGAPVAFATALALLLALGWPYAAAAVHYLV